MVDPVVGALPERKKQKGKLPRNLQDRSKYPVPHQSKREKDRRIRQAWKAHDPLDTRSGVIHEQTPPATEAEMLHNKWLADSIRSKAYKQEWPGHCPCAGCRVARELAEDRQDPPASGSV